MTVTLIPLELVAVEEKELTPFVRCVLNVSNKVKWQVSIFESGMERTPVTQIHTKAAIVYHLD